MRVLFLSLVFAVLATTVLYAFFPKQSAMPWWLVFSLSGIVTCGLSVFRSLLFPTQEEQLEQLMEDNRDALAMIEQGGDADCSEQAKAVLERFKQLIRESEYLLGILETVPQDKRRQSIGRILKIAQTAYQYRRCYDQLIGVSMNHP